MNEEKVSHTQKKQTSEEILNAITAVILISVAVAGVVYWLNGLPH